MHARSPLLSSSLPAAIVCTKKNCGFCFMFFFFLSPLPLPPLSSGQYPHGLAPHPGAPTAIPIMQSFAPGGMPLNIGVMPPPPPPQITSQPPFSSPASSQTGPVYTVAAPTSTLASRSKEEQAVHLAIVTSGGQVQLAPPRQFQPMHQGLFIQPAAVQSSAELSNIMQQPTASAVTSAEQHALNLMRAKEHSVAMSLIGAGNRTS